MGDEEEGSHEARHEGSSSHESHEGDEEEGSHEASCHEGSSTSSSNEGHEGHEEEGRHEACHEGCGSSYEGHEGDEEEGGHEGHEFCCKLPFSSWELFAQVYSTDSESS